MAVVSRSHEFPFARCTANLEIEPSSRCSFHCWHSKRVWRLCQEVGYLPFEQVAANLVSQLVSSRYEHASLVLTSNLPFSARGGVFGDQAVAAAMIDRIVHHADVLTLKGASDRLRDRGIDKHSTFRLTQRFVPTTPCVARKSRPRGPVNLGEDRGPVTSHPRRRVKSDQGAPETWISGRIRARTETEGTVAAATTLTLGRGLKP